MTTFLSTVSRYYVTIKHIAGISNLPADFQGRKAQECTEKDCQICKFIHEVDQSVIRNVTVKDIINGVANAPFTNKKS